MLKRIRHFLALSYFWGKEGNVQPCLQPLSHMSYPLRKHQSSICSVAASPFGLDIASILLPSMSGPPELDPQLVNSVKVKLSQDRPLNDDLRPGTYFDDPDYFDSLPRGVRSLACAIHRAGEHPDRPVICHSESQKFLTSYLASKKQEFLLSAIASEALALRWTPTGQPYRSQLNQHMGLVLAQKFELSNEPDDLDQAIRHTGLAVQHSQEDEERVHRLKYLASLLTKRYCLARQQQDLEEAKACLDRAHGLAKSDTTRLFILTHKLGLAHEASQTRQAAATSYLIEALALLDNTRLAAGIPHFPYHRIYRLAGRAATLLFGESMNQVWIEKAISYLAKSITLSSRDVATRVLVEEEHAEARRKRAHLLTESQDRERFVGILQDLIEENPAFLDFRVQLAEFYRSESHSATDTQSRQRRLDDAVELMEDAVSAMPAGFEGRGRVYDRCSAAYDARFVAFGLDADINRAIECSTLASTALDDSGSSWGFAYLLSLCLLDRYRKHQQRQDLTDALAAIDRATSLTGGESNPIGVAECKVVRGKIMQRQYDASLVEETLWEAIGNFDQAVQVLPKPSSSRAMALHDLGNAYSTLFAHNTNPEFLDKCIDTFKESVAGMEKLYSDPSHPDILMLNDSLGGAMLQRFRHWHLEQDVKSSISYFKKALGSLSSSDARYAPRAGNLCQALGELFGAQGDKADLKLLVEGNDKASAALERPEMLGNQLRSWLELQVGDLYCRAFGKTKLPMDRDTAIEHYDKAWALPDVSLPQRVLAMTNKALLLKLNAERTGLEADFQKAYALFQEVVTMLPENHPNAWTHANNLANLARTMHERARGGAGEGVYARVALENYKSVANSPSAALKTRISAASLAAALAFDVEHDAATARDLICICLELLPQSILPHENKEEQLKVLREYHWVPSGAAALSIAAGDPVTLAIQRLEAGRAHIWDRLLKKQTSAESVAAVDEDMATKFKGLQRQLSTQVTVGCKPDEKDEPSFVTPNDEIRLQREKVAREYQQLSKKIRKMGLIPEFLDPFNETGYLQKLANDAPVVLINASKYRSDALIAVKNKEPFSIQLPGFNMDEITGRGAVFSASEAMYSSDESEEIAKGMTHYNSVMKWLWEAAAKPVIDGIDFSSYARGPSGKPRIIWVATGWMAVLPIHAAGDFDGPITTGSSVHDRVVSTYTLSLNYLAFAKQERKNTLLNISPEKDTAMIVAMASTPGVTNGELKVDAEIQSFEEELRGSFRIEVQLQKGSHVVRDQLPLSSIAHFACHGHLDAKDPSKSALLLQDCLANDGRLKTSQPFRVWNILKTSMEKCALVYLSACDSGSSRDLLLRDEGLHVAGAFHMAGVPHVVSTLWKVRDCVAPSMSRHFYANLKNDQGTVDLGRSADAVHMAVQQLRDQGEQPMNWGPFIHSGP